MKKTLALIIGVVSFLVSNGQDHHVWGLFPTYNQNGSITQKLDYSIYTFLATYPQAQTTEGFVYPSKSSAFYIELDAIYSLSEAWSLAGSYTYERVNPFRTDYRNEHRVWLQAQHTHSFKKLNLKNRVRADFRFIENRFTEEIDFNPRVRYLLGVDFPISTGSVYFASYNEFFFDVYEERITTYAENWAFAGIGFNITPSTKLETGPLVISWIRNSSKDWLHQYFFQFTMIKQLDFTAGS